MSDERRFLSKWPEWQQNIRFSSNSEIAAFIKSKRTTRAEKQFAWRVAQRRQAIASKNQAE